MMKYLKIYEEFTDELTARLGHGDQLLDLMHKFDIPLGEWGQGQAKTLDHLRSEIEEGETDLTEEDGKLVRRVEFVGARVTYKKDGQWYRLWEDRQVFKDGRIRRRAHMPYSMAEKFKKGEDPKLVIVRGMDEELGLKVNPDQFAFYNRVQIENNDDYPGITSYHTGHEFVVVLNDEQYVEEGYVENQSDKDIFFAWRPIPRGGNVTKES